MVSTTSPRFLHASDLVSCWVDTLGLYERCNAHDEDDGEFELDDCVVVGLLVYSNFSALSHSTNRIEHTRVLKMRVGRLRWDWRTLAEESLEDLIGDSVGDLVE